jgi:lactate racemase
MRVTLDYGKTGLVAEIPDEHLVGVLNLREAVALPNPAESVREALRTPICSQPLLDIAQGKQNAVIVVCDITRPVPNPIILPELLATLRQAGIPNESVTILNATGTHRPNTPTELRQMLGDEAFETCQLVNHVCTDDDAMVYLGESPNGVPIRLNRAYVDADLKITVGMIEPHFMAGYAGGRKMVMPGVAALRTVQIWHSPRFLESPRATNGAVHDNPVHLEALWIANQCRPDFIVDVALDRNKKIAAVFAGDMEKAWETGVEFVAANNTAPVPALVDVVVTSCGGYPLDLTFYQTVKGMVGALPILKPGGTIIIASECAEGVGNAHFRDTLLHTEDIHEFLPTIQRPDWEFIADQWQVEELAKAVRNHHAMLICDGIEPEIASQLFVEPQPTIESAIQACVEKYGSEMTLAVIPKGPYIIPVVE